jgi:hypothetical protein
VSESMLSTVTMEDALEPSGEMTWSESLPAKLQPVVST